MRWRLSLRWKRCSARNGGPPRPSICPAGVRQRPESCSATRRSPGPGPGWSRKRTPPEARGRTGSRPPGASSSKASSPKRLRISRPAARSWTVRAAGTAACSRATTWPAGGRATRSRSPTITAATGSPRPAPGRRRRCSSSNWRCSRASTWTPWTRSAPISPISSPNARSSPSPTAKPSTATRRMSMCRWSASCRTPTTTPGARLPARRRAGNSGRARSRASRPRCGWASGAVQPWGRASRPWRLRAATPAISM